MRLRDSEDGHHRIADELFHRAAVELDDALHPVEIAHEKGAKWFRVEALAERGRAGEVAEENGDGLPLLACGLGGDRTTARLTEARTSAELMTARGAEGHGETLVLPTRDSKPG